MQTKSTFLLSVGAALIMLASMVDAFDYPAVVGGGTFAILIAGAMVVSNWFSDSIKP
jgi:hypothetical protein